ncbi:hypothetical protein EYV94_12075 [Puteibacter caeruleilacunae]|nr:hypothetical protein EYV94_12075 [Puteibacter caeruleilacunae]
MDMRILKLNLFAVIALLLANISFAQTQKVNVDALDCFSILVGKDASDEGCVYFAHNEDDGGQQVLNYYQVPRIEHEDGEVVTFKNGGTIPQAKVTYSYTWLQLPGMTVSDGFVNENGVVVGSDGCPSREDKPELTDGGVGYWIRRIIAERARTAKEGVKIAGQLVDQFGYDSSGRTYVVADANEGWMMSIVNGKHWVAQRVPDDAVAVLPNYYTIENVNLADTVNFLGSPDIIEYAIKRGWYDPVKDGEFNFAKAYTNKGSINHPGNYKRIWRGIEMISGEKYKMEGPFPFSFKPKQKVSRELLMSVLRDHYVGTELDKTDGYKLGAPYGKNGPTICANSTQFSFVAQLRDWMPTEVGTVVWLTTFRPDLQAYVPWYACNAKVPQIFGYGDHNSAYEYHYNPPKSIFETSDDLAYWSFVALAQMVDKDYYNEAPKVKKVWSDYQQMLFDNQQSIENKALKAFKKDPSAAQKILTNYSNKQVMKVFKEVKKMTKNAEKAKKEKGEQMGHCLNPELAK